jgi:hypothetical protein
VWLWGVAVVVLCVGIVVRVEVGQRTDGGSSNGRILAIVHVHCLVHVLLRFLSFGDHVLLWLRLHFFNDHVLLLRLLRLLRLLLLHVFDGYMLRHSVALAGHVLWVHLHGEDLLVFVYALDSRLLGCRR